MTDTRLLKAVAKRGESDSQRKQLQRFDWLLKALDIFIAEGIEAVRITRLAEDLGVTRGSFYWHFSNRDDLLDALLSYWKDKNTAAITEAVKEVPSLAEGIFRFIETFIVATLFDPRLDLAVREWARRSPAVRSQVDKDDAERIDSLSALFTRFGSGMPEALIRARVLYYSHIGFYALDNVEPLGTQLSYTEAYYECFTGKRLKLRDAEQFRNYMLDTYGDQR